MRDGKLVTRLTRDTQTKWRDKMKHAIWPEINKDNFPLHFLGQLNYELFTNKVGRMVKSLNCVLCIYVVLGNESVVGQ